MDKNSKLSASVEPNLFVYGIAKVVLYIFYKVFFRYRAFDVDKVPLASKDRGIIFAPNHASFLDPPIFGVIIGPHITFLAKEYLFRAFFLSWFLRSIAVLPIKSEADDFRSIRDLLRLLKIGKRILVFPEGTRTEDGNLKAPEVGIGFLAVKSQAWVVPVYIKGTFEAFPKGAKWFRPHPIRVYFGDAFIPAEDAEIRTAAEPYGATSGKIMREIIKIKSRVEKV